jgi:hypothetical protein
VALQSRNLFGLQANAQLGADLLGGSALASPPALALIGIIATAAWPHGLRFPITLGLWLGFLKRPAREVGRKPQIKAFQPLDFITRSCTFDGVT